MTKNSDKRRKKFKKPASKKKAKIKSSTANTNRYWDQDCLRETILTNGWYIVEAMVQDANLFGMPTFQEDVNFVLNKVTKEITGYSPISDEWDDRYDSASPGLRADATRYFFGIKKLLEETVNAICYYHIINGKVHSWNNEFSYKIDKKTLPFKTLTCKQKSKKITVRDPVKAKKRHNAKKCTKECWGSKWKKLENLNPSERLVYITYGRDQLNLISRMVIAILNHLYWGNQDDYNETEIENEMRICVYLDKLDKNELSMLLQILLVSHSKKLVKAANCDYIAVDEGKHEALVDAIPPKLLNTMTDAFNKILENENEDYPTLVAPRRRGTKRKWFSPKSD
tara:strand:- start:307 stop:1326 length:1020 start_codon:yes stop_codon:yes gene_type:complete